MGELDSDAEEAVIRDWLAQSGGADGRVDKGGNGPLDPWIAAIAEEIHGWPRHVINFVSPATDTLREVHGDLGAVDLQTVLERGVQNKLDYYDSRVKEIDQRSRLVLAAAVQYSKRQGEKGIFDEIQVKDLLEEIHPPRTDIDEQFNRVLNKGVLAWIDSDYLKVPIPSMEDWLVNKFRTYAKRFPSRAARIRAAVKSALAPDQKEVGGMEL